MTSSSSLRSSVSAAFFGASAGVVTKLTFDPARLGKACAQVLAEAEENCSRPEVIYPLQATGIALIVLLNLFMLRSFNAALQSSPTTLQASLLTTAANLVITAFFGYLLFGEELSIRWWLGTVLIVSGIALLGRDDKVKSD